MSRDVPTFELASASTAHTLAIGRAVGRCCREGDVITLKGELGAGKTQLVRGLAEGLGLDASQVSSPTFVVVQEYEPAGEAGGALSLIHVDAYRVTGPDELVSVGFDLDDAEYRTGAVVAIEWPARLGTAFSDALGVAIDHAPPSRCVSLTLGNAWAERFEALRRALADTDTSPGASE